jgi:hypothetical protein
MKSFSSLFAAALACGCVAFAAQERAKPGPPPPPPASPAPAPVPFAAETLRYSVNWPSGLSLGEAQMMSRRAGDQWRFAFSLDAAVPGFVVSDLYQSTAGGDFCSADFVKTFTHGKKKANEKLVFDAQKRSVKRTTLAEGGAKEAGVSETSTAACARDALAFLYYLRRELNQGRTPPPQTIYFGAPYQVRIEFGGAQKVRGVEADRVHVSLKGPASAISFDAFFAHDAARTLVEVRVPFPVGSLTMELVR